MTIALFCIALLGILLFALGLMVSLTRGRTEVVSGYPDDPSDSLHKLVRAHGNAGEYVGMLAVLIFAVASVAPGTWSAVAMIGATVSRYLIAAGMIANETLAKPHPLRFVGALGTYVFGFWLCAALLFGIAS